MPGLSDGLEAPQAYSSRLCSLKRGFEHYSYGCGAPLPTLSASSHTRSPLQGGYNEESQRLIKATRNTEKPLKPPHIFW